MNPEIDQQSTSAHPQQVDGLIENARIATFDTSLGTAYGLIENATIAWRHGKICYLGETSSAPTFATSQVIDAQGKLLTPGFVDCHTHLVFSGDRSAEYAARLSGQSYASIAQNGGGIMATVNATRQSDLSALVEAATQRIQRLYASGVTSVEIKSGYGLDFDNEIKLLRAIKTLRETLPLTIKATCLAAHTVPKDFSGTKDDYIHWVCHDLLPIVKAEKLADAVDIFCEGIAFSSQHMQQLFRTAQTLGFAVKAHVEQLSQNQGIDVACEFAGLSVDHIEYANEAQVQAMAKAGVTAVLLPGAYYYLGEPQKPPVSLLRQHKVPMAVATDLNPGSSPLYSITHAANMASTLFGLTPEESLMGITVNGAKALGLEKCKGTLAMGMDADLLLWPIANPNLLVYELPAVQPQCTWLHGVETPTIR